MLSLFYSFITFIAMFFYLFIDFLNAIIDIHYQLFGYTMIRILIILFVLLTIGLFIFSKIKPELFHKVKEHSILHTLILVGISVTSVVSFFLGTYLSVITKVQVSDSLRYFDNINESLGSIILVVLTGLAFIIPWSMVIKYIFSFKYLARYIVRKLNLQLIMDIYDFD